jgi:hypothetical protein
VVCTIEWGRDFQNARVHWARANAPINAALGRRCLELAPTGGSRQCSGAPAIEGKADCRGKSGRGSLLCPNSSHIKLFGHLECVIDLDAKVSRGALDLGVPEQQLHGTQVAGSAIDQRGLGSAQ